MSAGQYTPEPDGGAGAGTPETDRITGRQAGARADASPTDGRAAMPPYPADAPARQGTRGDVPPSSAPAGTAERKVTRTGMVWAAVVAALVVLILLIIFILQNQELVLVKFLGLEGAVPLGMALFIASVTGGVLVAAAGGARILQLRASAHRARQRR
ncbi:hypothetical protein NtRootA9_02780 [Arthrobacter sp. NtRootA9]|nr:hypothetical protein NtRootA9_02780 [Arthrobacter sp. NtRootA9]